MKEAHYIILKDSVLLSKKNYADWKEIQNEFEDYKASLGPWTKDELIGYFTEDFKEEKRFPISIERLERFFCTDEYMIFENGKLCKEDFEPVFPWLTVSDEKRHNILTNELKKEIHEGHYLYGKKFHIIGEREDRDDAAVFLENDCAIAFVHLTWKMNKEHGAWPLCRVFLNRKDLNRQIELDNKEMLVD